MMVTMKYRSRHLRRALVVATLLVSAGGSSSARVWAEPTPVRLVRASVVRQAPRVLTEPEVGTGVGVRLRRMNERHEAYQARRRDAAGGPASGRRSATGAPASLPREPLPLPPDLLDGVNQ
jgi:hypothetical protein